MNRMVSRLSCLRLRGKLMQATPKHQNNVGLSSRESLRSVFLLGAAGVTGLMSCATVAYADEATDGLNYANFPWPRKDILNSCSDASIQRGPPVYQQACASCHSTFLNSSRDSVAVAHTEEEVKIEVIDRPSDHFPKPYRIAKAAIANGGPYSVDLSLITKARYNGQNCVLSLLTGYRDPPAGVSIRDMGHYNGYFSGGAMAKMLSEGATEYKDGASAKSLK